MSAPGTTISRPVGADLPATTLQAYLADGSAAANVFQAGDVPSAQVWAGQDQAPVFAPTCAWVSLAAGTLSVAFAGSATAAMAPGLYRLRVSVTRGAQTVPAVEAWLELVEAPGAATAPTTYGTADGVREHLPNADRYEPKSGLAAFLRERGRARQWIDSVILAKAPAGRYSGLTPHNEAIINWCGPGLGRSRLLKTYLDANKLVLTNEIVEAANRYAAHLVLKGVIAQKADDSARRRAAELLVEAHSWLANAVAEIDINGDGFGEWNIALGVTNTRYA